MKKILIIEDEYYIIEDVGEWLKKEGDKVDVATNFPEAKECIEKTNYDVVLLDIMLPTSGESQVSPERAGVEILKVICEKSPKPKVIILTGVVNDKTISELNKYPYDELLLKPVDAKELCSFITGKEV